MADTFDSVSLNDVLDVLRYKVCKKDCPEICNTTKYDDWLKGCCGVCYLGEAIAEMSQLETYEVDMSLRKRRFDFKKESCR